MKRIQWRLQCVNSGVASTFFESYSLPLMVPLAVIGSRGRASSVLKGG